jgi:exodeoxyribonuclease V beta subunit
MIDHPVLKLKLEGRSLIEASAGTGKTWSIAKLFVRALIEKQLLPREVLVVTFTNAATSELKERLYRELSECEQWLSATLQQSEVPTNNFYPLWLDRQGDIDLVQTLAWVRRCIHRFDEAAISTLQGFCEGLVIRYGIEFGVELVAENATAMQSSSSNGIVAAVSAIYRHEVEFINGVDDVIPEKAGFLRAAIGSFNQLLKCVVELLQKPAVKGTIEAKSCEAARQGLLRTSIFSAFKEFKDSVSEGAIQELVTYGNQLLASGNYRKGIRPKQFNEAVLGLQSLAKHGTIDSTLLTRLDRLTKGLISKTELKASLISQGYTSAASLPVVVALQKYLLAYQAFEKEADEFRQHLVLAAYDKAKAALLDGNDTSFNETSLGFTRTLLLAAQGLAKTPAVGLQIVARYPVALVDEFQDTDPIQASILNAIYPVNTSLDQSEANYALVMVGDPKQAIYNFRGADVYAYLKAKVTATQVYSLDTNQRSTLELVESVNSLFMSLPQVFNVPGIEFLPVHASGRHPVELPGPALRFLTMPEVSKDDEDDESDSPPSGLTCWSWVAEEIERLISEPTLQGNSVKASDIAVLVRSNKNAVLMKDALAARKIGARLESKESVWTRSSAQQLVWFLEGVASFNEPLLLRKALMTPLGDWTLSRLGPAATELSNIRGLSDQVLTFFAKSRAIWINEGFAAFWTSLGLFGQTQVRFSELRQLVELALTAPISVELKKQEPAQLIAWLQNAIDVAIEASKLEVADPAFKLRTPAADNQVQLATIHASKGLEYKIVFLPDGLDKLSTRNASMRPVTFFERDLTLLVDLHSSKFQSDEVKEAALREQGREEMRLLYVAVTRAVQSCYLFFDKKIDDKKNKERRALQLLRARRAREPMPFFEVARSSAMAIIEATDARDDEFDRIADLPPLKNLPTLQTQAIWQIESFSGLARRGAHENHPLLESSLDSSEQLDQTEPSFADLLPKGAHTGECLHAILEKADWQQPLFGPGNLKLVARYQTQFGLSAVDSHALAQWMDTLLDTPLIAPADLATSHAGVFSLRDVVPNKVIREWRFDNKYGEQAPYDRRLNYLRGFVDLVFEHEGKFYVVDYKSNWLGSTQAAYTPETIAKVMLANRYDLQARIYAAALKNFLATRLGDVEVRQRFGGVLYLFLRAMRPDQPGRGVFHVVDHVA